MKKWYQSKTIGGIALAVIGALFVAIGMDPGVTLPPNPDVQQAQEYIAQVKNAEGNVSTIIGVVLNAIGYLVAIWGRIKAETTIA